jgi:hypothetical protein
VEVTSGDEQILFIALPADPQKSPQQVASDTVQVFRRDMPDLTASDWRAGEKSENRVVYFKSAYTQAGTRFASDALVMKDPGSSTAIWISFSGPASGYSKARASNILQGVLGSLAKGAGSMPPNVSAAVPGTPSPVANRQRETRIAENVRGFLFVLEFAISAPLTEEQERVIGGELRGGWEQRSDAELAKFDAYPQLAKAILRGNPEKVEAMRSEMEKSTLEWLNDSDQKDPGVRGVQEAISTRGKVVVEGTQPLTAMAAQSISEMLAYSHLLQEQPNAMPSDVAAESVAAQKQRILAAWKALPTETRDAVTGSPGLWVTMRALLRYGTPEDQQRARDRILQMTGNSQAARERGSTDTTRKPASNMIKHNVMMDIQRQTFNTYMWSHGFNYSRTAGKLW